METKIRKLNKEVRGITLVALVVTIIVILILAGVALNFTIGDNGIFSRANRSRIEYDIAQTKETLDLIFVDAYAEKTVNPEYNQDEFLDDYVYSKNKEVIMEEDMVTLNGYTFELNRAVPEVGEYIGEAGNLPPSITRIEVIEKGMTNVKIEVTVARAEGVTYRYSYKKLEDVDFIQAGEAETNSYEYTGLESAKIYTIKVELVKNNEVVDSEEIEVMPGELEEGAITFGTPVWTSGVAEVTISTNTEYRIQYQVGGIDGSWTEVTNGGKVGNIQNGQTVYARLYDGTNAGEYTSIKIEDNVDPTINEIQELKKTFKSIKIKVNAIDEESGIVKIEYSKDNGANYTIGTSNTATEYEFTELEQGTEYTIKVRVTDNSNNTAEKSINIKAKGERFSDIYTETEKYTDSAGNTAWIPKGFAVGVDKEINKINDGLVITDKINEENYGIGNEFVWIPVDDESLNEMYTVVETPAKLSGVTTTTKVYSKLRWGVTASAPNTTGYREPDLITQYDTNSNLYSILASSAQEMADDMVTEYTEIYESIKQYDGFYIGRFELTGTIENPTVQREEKVLTSASPQNWYHLKKASTNVITKGEDYDAQSAMIYRNQWEKVIQWLVDTGDKTEYQITTNASDWGNYTDNTSEGKGEARPSGYNETWKANNIYDIAGNYGEWSQGAYRSKERIAQGGGYSVTGTGIYAPSKFHYADPTYDASATSTRAIMYLK